MTTADIVLEYRQLKAIEYEEKTGKKYEEAVVDDGYEAWQKSIGVDPEKLNA